MKKLGFLALFAFAGMSVGFADLPPSGKTTSDMAIYQSNSEITVPRQGRLSFDQDLKNLNEMEHRYHERLPRLSERPELVSPMKRISKTKYHPAQMAAHAARGASGRAGRAAPAIKKVKAVRKAHRAERPVEHLKPSSSSSRHEIAPRVIFPDERNHPHSRD